MSEEVNLDHLDDREITILTAQIRSDRKIHQLLADVGISVKDHNNNYRDIKDILTDVEKVIEQGEQQKRLWI